MKYQSNVWLRLRIKLTMHWVLLTGLFLIAVAPLNTCVADEKGTEISSIIAEKLRKGQYAILLRHALAPGTGDPPGFNVDDCRTQRNISKSGRQQARDIGMLLKVNGIEQANVYSSQWCRCLETARLLKFGQVRELEIINSFFRNFERKPEQTQQLREWLSKNKALGTNKRTAPSILVTHQVNITALTGVFPGSGELVIIEIDQSGGIDVITRLSTAVP